MTLTTVTDELSRKHDARVAGSLYLLMSIVSVVSFTYVPTWIVAGGDAAAIVNRIEASQLSYRIGLLSDLAGQILSVFAALALYQLFKDVNKKQAAVLTVLALVGVPMSFVTMLLGMAPLALLSGADYLSAFDHAQLSALTMGCLTLRGYGIRASMALWGVLLLPFGLLVYRSGFIPRILGVILIVGCFAYLTVSVGSLLFPNDAAILSRLLVLSVGEILIILWLVIKGTRAT